MKKKIFAGVLALMTLTLGACGFSSPEGAVSHYMEALLSLNSADAAQYVEPNSDPGQYFPTGAAGDFAKELFPYIEVTEVTTEDESETTATVTITFQGPDIDSLQTAAMDQGLSLYTEDPNLTPEDLQDQMVDYFAASLPDAISVENTISVEVTKSQDQWLLPQTSQAAILQTLTGSLGQVEIITQ